MEILGRYDNSGIALEGTEESLLELSDAIEKLSEVEILPLLDRQSSHDPYPGHAKSLRLVLSEEPVCIGLCGDEISVRGAANKLKILAQNIRFVAEEKKQDSSGRIRPHVHIEYYPDHSFLKAESIPLVVTKIENSRSI